MMIFQPNSYVNASYECGQSWNNERGSAAQFFYSPNRPSRLGHFFNRDLPPNNTTQN